MFNWIATMYRGSMTFETPMLFAIGFIFVFTMGGFTGLILALAPIDIQVQDTYYVVAHFHYVLVAGSLFSLFAGAYYWLPKWTGHMYDEKLGKWHFWLSMIFFNVTFFPMHFMGLAGMPRRYADYPMQFADFMRLERSARSDSDWRSCCSCTSLSNASGAGQRQPPIRGTRSMAGSNGRCRRRRHFIRSKRRRS